MKYNYPLGLAKKGILGTKTQEVALLQPATKVLAAATSNPKSASSHCQRNSKARALLATIFAKKSLILLTTGLSKALSKENLKMIFAVKPRGAHKRFQYNNKSGFTELSFSRVPKTGIRNEKEIKVQIFSFLGVGLELATLRL